MILPTFMLFLLTVIVVAFVVLSFKKRREEPRVHEVLCPETRQTARVELDRGHEIVTFFRTHCEAKLKSCTRWPERADCDTDCIAQIEPQMKAEEILSRWYDGQNCAECGMPLIRADWQRGRAAGLDETGKFVPLREMDWRQFPMALDAYRPICRKCHDRLLEQARAERATA
jgi:hypothetical protein